MNYELFNDELMTHFTSEFYSQEVKEAKTEYYGGSGPIDSEGQDYEIKMLQFVEWYLFSRKLTKYNISPAERAKDEDGFSLWKDYPEIYKNLINHRHSLFEFIKLSKGDLHIRDVISQYKFVINESPVTLGFNKGEIFEARLVPHEQSFWFMKAFCFHPPQATKYILKEIKGVQNSKEDKLKEKIEELISKLKNKKNKYEQYKHVAVESIYSNDSKI